MGRIIVRDNLKKFVNQNIEVMDNALEKMAKDTKTVASIRIPYKGGDLQDDMETKKVGRLRHRVVVDSEYAAPQERGRRLTGVGAPTKQFRNYTTPGTGRDFLKGAGEVIAKDAVNYFKQAANLNKL